MKISSTVLNQLFAPYRASQGRQLASTQTKNNNSNEEKQSQNTSKSQVSESIVDTLGRNRLTEVEKGISKLNSANSALNQVKSIISQARELAVQANGFGANRQALNTSANKLLTQANQIVQEATENGQSLLKPGSSPIEMPTGAASRLRINLGESRSVESTRRRYGVKEWTKVGGTSNDDLAEAVARGSDGSIYVGGRTAGNLDGYTAMGLYDAFLTKYNADGTKAWTRVMGSTSGGWDDVNALVVGEDGSIYMAGYATGNFEGKTSNGQGDAFVTKFSTDGTKQWTQLIGSSEWDGAYALAMGSDGSIYVGGRTEGTLAGQTSAGSSDGFIAKLNTDGTRVWTKQFGTSDWEGVWALAAGKDGTVYAGRSANVFRLPTDPNMTATSALMKLNADGTTAWSQELADSSGEGLTSLAVNKEGSLFVGGWSAWKGRDGATYNGGWNDGFVSKYTDSGSRVWTQSVGTHGWDRVGSVATGPDGAVYASGFTTGNLDGETSYGFNLGDAFVVRFDGNGQRDWTKLVGTTSADTATNLTVGTDGSLFLVGGTQGSLDGQTNSGMQDYFVTKFATATTETEFKRMNLSFGSIDLSSRESTDTAIQDIDLILKDLQGRLKTSQNAMKRATITKTYLSNISSINPKSRRFSS